MVHKTQNEVLLTPRPRLEPHADHVIDSIAELEAVLG